MAARWAAPVATAAVIAAAAVWGQTLSVSQIKNEVRIAAPGFHFLTGKPLERLRNGNAVAFDFLLAATGDSRTSVLARAFERYVVSYDLWEQTYSVSRMKSNRGQAGHLTAAQAESWCLEGISLPISALPKDQPLWFRLEVRARNGRPSDPVFDDPGLSLAGLIELFSRAGGAAARDQWKLEAGPIRLKAAGKS